jgi:hypothetical protein
MADKLRIYNDALFELKTRPIATLTDDRPERRGLDYLWPSVEEYLLEAGLWNFALRVEELQPSDTAASVFGWSYVYEYPDDYVKTIAISEDQWLQSTLKAYSLENDYIMAEIDPLYLGYVSNDIEYGRDVGKWPGSFARAFALELAARGSGNIGSLSINERKELRNEADKRLRTARSRDAFNQAPSRFERSLLVTARRGAYGGTNAQRRTPYS